jgi:hypothetical protein
MGTVTLATLSPSQSHTYRLTLSFNTVDGSPSLQGCTTSARLVFDIVSA